MHTPALIVGLAAMMLSTGSVMSQTPESAIAVGKTADHEQALQNLIRALKVGDRVDAADFLDRHFGGSNPDDVATIELMRRVLGPDFRFHSVIERSGDRIVGLVSDAAGTRWTGVILEFRGAEGRVSAMSLRKAAAPGSASLTPASRATVVRDAALWLRRGYVIPGLGPRMADAILEHLEKGVYEGIQTAEALALRLTHDLRDIYKDLHLAILSPSSYQARRVLEAHGFAAEARVEDTDQRHRWYEHGGMSGLWWRESGRSVGVIEFSTLIASPQATDAVRRALREVAQRDGIIIDLRGVPGHEGSMAEEIVSHFVRERSKISEFERVDPTTGKRSREASWVDPGELSPVLRGKPCFVLVDQGTASAAEALASLMRRVGGATLIGARTAGAGHMVTTVSLAQGFGLKLPIGRAVDGNSSEGLGVTPDEEVAPKEALSRALKLLDVRGAPGTR